VRLVGGEGHVVARRQVGHLVDGAGDKAAAVHDDVLEDAHRMLLRNDLVTAVDPQLIQLDRAPHIGVEAAQQMRTESFAVKFIRLARANHLHGGRVVVGDQFAERDTEDGRHRVEGFQGGIRAAGLQGVQRRSRYTGVPGQRSQGYSAGDANTLEVAGDELGYPHTDHRIVGRYVAVDGRLL